MRRGGLNIVDFFSNEGIESIFIIIMVLHGFFQKKAVRKFGFTPFYYEEPDSADSEETESRIKFRKILRSTPAAKRSVRSMLFLAILLVVCLFSLWGLANDETRSFQLEDIRIEETPK